MAIAIAVAVVAVTVLRSPLAIDAWYRPIRVAAPIALTIGVAIVLANVVLDTRVPERFHSVVLAKHRSRGRGSHRTLRVAPWGPFDEPQRFDVGASQYEETPVGATVCIALHPGALGGQWYRIEPCRADEPATAARALVETR